jgi:hypothetical protein
VVAGILIKAGLYLGTDLNASIDALPFVPFYDRWANDALRYWNQPLPASLVAQIRRDLATAVRRHKSRMTHDQAGWGWKNPRSMLVLPWLHEAFPGLRFVHVIRDGRDMAYSPNQNQLELHGEVVLGPAIPAEPLPVRSIRYWSRVNLAAADYCAASMPTQYLNLRFEDLCLHPERSISELLEFAGLRPRASAAHLSKAVVPPASVGRWLGFDRQEIALVQNAGAAALRRFGYRIERFA